MKATLEFNLPEDQYELDCALSGSKWQGAMRDFDEWMRRQVKYGTDDEIPDGVTQEEWQASVDVVREVFWERISDIGGFVEE